MVCAVVECFFEVVDEEHGVDCAVLWLFFFGVVDDLVFDVFEGKFLFLSVVFYGCDDVGCVCEGAVRPDGFEVESSYFLTKSAFSVWGGGVSGEEVSFGVVFFDFCVDAGVARFFSFEDGVEGLLECVCVVEVVAVFVYECLLDEFP